MKYADEHTIETLVEEIKGRFASKKDVGLTPIMSALYTGLYYGANSTKNGYFEPICVKPKNADDVIGEYHIKFKMTTTCAAYPSYSNSSIVDVWFNRTGSVNCYAAWNWRVGSYLHYSVGVCYPSTNANFNTKGTHLGVGITNGNNYNNANYKRDTLIEILEVSDDLVVTLDNPEDTKQYTKMPWYNATDYPNHTTLNAVDVGLQESGDLNTYDRTYFGSTSMTVSSRFRSVASTLNAFDQDGKYFSLGQYGTAADITTRHTATSKGEWASGTAYAIGDYVHYTNDIYYRCIKAHTASASILPTNTTYWQVYREYNHNGIDYKRGLFYGCANYDKGATTNMSIYFAITCIDLRYTFNCLASNAAANTLGTEMGKNVYIRGYIKDGLFYIAPTTVTYSNNPYYKCWTQDPVDETIEVDGITYSVCYWLIGSAYYNSSYTTRGFQVNLFAENPMFVFKEGRLVEYADASKQDVIADLDVIRSGAAKGETALQTHQDISGKQDVIGDLATIRSGASKGNTAVQPSAISDMETKTHAGATYQPKGNYLTEHQDISGKADLASPTLTGVPKAPTAGSATSTTQIATTQFVQQEIDRRASEFHFTVATGSIVVTRVESVTSIL